jgi:hypothetical protein
MGSNFANDLSTMEEITLDNQIAMHLVSNHYPPVPTSMVPACIEAIGAYNDEDGNREIKLPTGTTWRGKEYAPAYEIINAHHLQSWLYDDDEDY